jgi:subtilisin family serine protease
MTPLLLSLALAAAPDRSFYPGRGADRWSIDASGRLGGVPVQVLPELLVAVQDPALLTGLPGLQGAEALPGPSGRYALRLDHPERALALSRALHGQPGWIYATPNLRFRLLPVELPDDPYLAEQWHLENDGHLGGEVDVNAELAWELATGAGQLIAVYDSGVEVEHPDLRVVPGGDYIGDDDDPDPEGEAHGTSASGLAAAIGDNGVGVAGLAHGAEVYAVRIIGGDTTLRDLYNAFVEGVDAGATVLSNSWGWGEGCPDIPLYGTLEDTLAYAEQEGRGGLGSVVVFAAGNGGCDASNNEMLAYESVLTVGAISRWDLLESYSSYGDVVDLVAPSGGVLTTDIQDGGYGDHGGDPGYTPYFSGTSAATPIVSGAMALILELRPELSAAQARALVMATATTADLEHGDYNSEGWSPYYGWGRLDAGAAAWAVAGGPPAAPALREEGAERSAARVLLRWEEAVDPDGDLPLYELSWWREGEEAHSLDLGRELETDLTGLVSEGEQFSWTVRARDDWSWGPAAEAQSVQVVAPAEAPIPEEPDIRALWSDDPPRAAPGGCATAGAGSALWGLAALAGRRRRRQGR